VWLYLFALQLEDSPLLPGAWQLFPSLTGSAGNCSFVRAFAVSVSKTGPESYPTRAFQYGLLCVFLLSSPEALAQPFLARTKQQKEEKNKQICETANTHARTQTNKFILIQLE